MDFWTEKNSNLQNNVVMCREKKHDIKKILPIRMIQRLVIFSQRS